MNSEQWKCTFLKSEKINWKEKLLQVTFFYCSQLPQHVTPGWHTFIPAGERKWDFKSSPVSSGNMNQTIAASLSFTAAEVISNHCVGPNHSSLQPLPPPTTLILTFKATYKHATAELLWRRSTTGYGVYTCKTTHCYEYLFFTEETALWNRAANYFLSITDVEQRRFCQKKKKKRKIPNPVKTTIFLQYFWLVFFFFFLQNFGAFFFSRWADASSTHTDLKSKWNPFLALRLSACVGFVLSIYF